MRPVLLAAYALAILALSAASCASATFEISRKSSGPDPIGSTEPTASADPGEPEATSDTESPAPPPDARPGVASWIFDGDSIDVDFTDGADPSSSEIRLIGVNAPEAQECLGEEAKNALIDRLGREPVRVAVDRWDEFGRDLAFVWHEGELINLWLVDSGLAVARSAFGHSYDKLLDDAEERAKFGERGLWNPSACGTAADTAVSIAHVNFDAEGRDNENPNGEWIDIVNNGPIDVELRGWTIRDESTRHRYQFASTVLTQDTTLRLRSGCGADTATEHFWCDPDGTIWSNSGDTAFLYDASGALVDSVSWGSIYDD